MLRIRALTFVLAAIMATSGASAPARRVSATTATSPSSDTLSGLFILQLMNGTELPSTKELNGLVYTLHAVSIAFRLNGTYTQSTTVTVTRDGRTLGVETDTLQGRFDYAASTHVISLRGSSGFPMAGTVVNDVMTLQVVRDTAVFYRQY
jgi:hypothetical protein